jgi:hypothetical protein
MALSLSACSGQSEEVQKIRQGRHLRERYTPSSNLVSTNLVTTAWFRKPCDVLNSNLPDAGAPTLDRLYRIEKQTPTDAMEHNVLLDFAQILKES